MTTTFTFPGCWVHIDVEARFLQSVFPDGRILTSIPVPEKDIATARSYGYGDDWFRLWRKQIEAVNLQAGSNGQGQSTDQLTQFHEIGQLRSELEAMTRQRDILKKAIGICAEMHSGGLK